jgi:hypothetical protein
MYIMGMVGWLPLAAVQIPARLWSARDEHCSAARWFCFNSRVISAGFFVGHVGWTVFFARAGWRQLLLGAWLLLRSTQSW